MKPKNVKNVVKKKVFKPVLLKDICNKNGGNYEWIRTPYEGYHIIELRRHFFQGRPGCLRKEATVPLESLEQFLRVYPKIDGRYESIGILLAYFAKGKLAGRVSPYAFPVKTWFNISYYEAVDAAVENTCGLCSFVRKCLEEQKRSIVVPPIQLPGCPFVIFTSYSPEGKEFYRSAERKAYARKLQVSNAGQA
jgi:hypothetical protein